MNLVDILNGRNIAGVQESTLKTILEGSHPSLNVKMATNGMVMLTDNTIIKCVDNYYTNPNSLSDTSKFKKSSAACHYVQDDLGVRGAGVNNCRTCHLQCMLKRSNGELRRNYK